MSGENQRNQESHNSNTNQPLMPTGFPIQFMPAPPMAPYMPMWPMMSPVMHPYMGMANGMFPSPAFGMPNPCSEHSNKSDALTSKGATSTAITSSGNEAGVQKSKQNPYLTQAGFSEKPGTTSNNDIRNLNPSMGGFFNPAFFVPYGGFFGYVPYFQYAMSAANSSRVELNEVNKKEEKTEAKIIDIEERTEETLPEVACKKEPVENEVSEDNEESMEEPVDEINDNAGSEESKESGLSAELDVAQILINCIPVPVVNTSHSSQECNDSGPTSNKNRTVTSGATKGHSVSKKGPLFCHSTFENKESLASSIRTTRGSIYSEHDRSKMHSSNKLKKIKKLGYLDGALFKSVENGNYVHDTKLFPGGNGTSEKVECDEEELICDKKKVLLDGKNLFSQQQNHEPKGKASSLSENSKLLQAEGIDAKPNKGSVVKGMEIPSLEVLHSRLKSIMKSIDDTSVTTKCLESSQTVTSNHASLSTQNVKFLEISQRVSVGGDAAKLCTGHFEVTRNDSGLSLEANASGCSKSKISVVGGLDGNEIMLQESEQSESTESQITDEQPLVCEDSDTRMAFKCEVCLQLFRSPLGLQKHCELHAHNGQHHACSVCYNRFKSAEELEEHVLSHIKRRPYKCNYCTKSFRDPGSLQKHVRIHTGEKPFKCTSCPRSFAEYSSLRKHQRVHTGEQPYRCPHCDKAFSISGNLQRHILIHTGEKPYQCSFCSKAFNNPSHLRRHVTNMHIKAGDADIDDTIISHFGLRNGHSPKSSTGGRAEQGCDGKPEGEDVVKIKELATTDMELSHEEVVSTT